MTNVIKDHKSLSAEEKDAFHEAKRGKVDFLLNDAVKPIPINDVPDDIELQPLKWVLAKRTNSEDIDKTRHRARLVAASHKCMLRHAIHGNVPAVMLSTLRMLASIVST